MADRAADDRLANGSNGRADGRLAADQTASDSVRTSADCDDEAPEHGAIATGIAALGSGEHAEELIARADEDVIAKRRGAG